MGLTARALAGLGPIDLKSVARDSLLRWIVFVPILIALLVRWGVPVVATRLDERFGFDLAPYHTLIASFVVLTVPMIVGVVLGFLLLDQKDDRTLSALQVTPLGLGGYLVYRLGVPVAISVIMTLVAVPLTGLAGFRPAVLLPAALAAAPLAPVYALLLAAFARDKVQGFALMKAAGFLNWPPLLAWFAPLPWQWAFGCVPTYWPAKLYWLLERGRPGVAALYFTAGLAYQALLLWLLMRRFTRIMQR